MMACLLMERCIKYIQKGDKQEITYAKIMKVVKTLTHVSLIHEVFEFLPNSNKQDGGINKRGLIIKTVQNQPEKFDAYQFFYNTEVFKTEALEVVANVRKKCYHLTVGCLLGRVNSNYRKSCFLF